MMSTKDDLEITSNLMKGGIVGLVLTGPGSTALLSSVTELPFFSCFLGGSVVAILTAYIPALVSYYKITR